MDILYISDPPPPSIPPTKPSDYQIDLLQKEVNTLMRKNAVKEVLLYQKGLGVYFRKIWLEIQSKVNAVEVTPRDIDDLKKRWYDLRSITKKKIAELHKEANKTGGGKNRAPPLTELEELVGSTIEPESVCGLGDADSSARAATRKGETSRRCTREKEVTAPQRDDSQEAGTNAENGTDDTGASTPLPPSQDLEMSPHLQASPECSGSPLLLSSPELPASQPQITPAPQKSRRHAVAPLLEMDTSAGEMEGDDTQTLAGEGSTATQQSSAEVARTGTRRRRARDSSAAQHVEGPSVFRGLEGSMVKIQRMQGKAIQSVQRQIKHLNTHMENIGKGISALVDENKEMASDMKEMAAGVREMTQSVQLLCTKLDQDRLARRTDRQHAQQQTKAMNRLATDISLLCRPCIYMQEGLTHSSNEVSRGLASVTSAVEVLLNSQTAQTAALDVPESEESTSRSSMTSPPVVETRRSSRRHGDPTPQTPSEDSQPLSSGTGKCGRK
ncbi:uncharacterized protein LOC144785321 [Lissotriton helveticus]